MNANDYMSKLVLRTPGDIGALIKDRRRALGLDQADLAQQIGVSRLWVNQIERGKPGAGIGLILRALAAVGVELTTDTSGEPGEAHSSARLAVTNADINAILTAARRVGDA